MIHKLIALLYKIRDLGDNAQLTMLAGPEGGVAIVVAYTRGDQAREVAMQYTAAELERATEDAMLKSIDRLFRSVDEVEEDMAKGKLGEPNQ